MPATPVLSNGGTERGLPISCFLNEASDSLEGITNLWEEMFGLQQEVVVSEVIGATLDL